MAGTARAEDDAALVAAICSLQKDDVFGLLNAQKGF
jgi:hypothetical protein